ncbi:MAG: oxygenase MpaB family protein [Gordonia sp. (in: high G+C Gram-positive bacteria)]|uniref:oxygenase MpaB family protein n=1 Tax=Gordonia sp. (in: high G+C Gram-positive bacteria) TaxID=84139 RepID=UPI0039E6C0A0
MTATSSSAIPSYVPADQRPERMSREEMDALVSTIPLHSAALLAGPANVIMQMANAPVGRGVVESKVESGNILKHPIKRTRTTLSYLAVAAIGSPADRKAYREAVNSAHRQVHSTKESPVKYNAMDPKLQLWVAACLYKGWEDTERLYGHKKNLSEEHYRMGATMGTTLQMPYEMWPETRADFQKYWDETVAGIEMDEEVRKYLTKLAKLTFLGEVPTALLGWYAEALTLGYLPTEFQDMLKLHPTKGQKRFFDAHNVLIRTATRLTPKPIQELPFRVLLADVRRRIRTGQPLI